MSDSVNSAWSFVRVDEIFEIKQGKQVSQKTRDGNNQKSFLRTKNVFWNRLDLSELDQMNFTESEEKRLKLEYGDLLLCKGSVDFVFVTLSSQAPKLSSQPAGCPVRAPSVDGSRTIQIAKTLALHSL
jgi:hypothetical protein